MQDSEQSIYRRAIKADIQVWKLVKRWSDNTSAWTIQPIQFYRGDQYQAKAGQ